MDVVLHLVQELRIKGNELECDELDLVKEKIVHFFVTFTLSKETFFNICILSQCIVYEINFKNIYTFTHQKTLLHAFLLLVFKIVESLRCIFKESSTQKFIFVLRYWNFVNLEFFLPSDFVHMENWSITGVLLISSK